MIEEYVGMDSRDSRKTFKNQVVFNKFFPKNESNNVEVLQSQNSIKLKKGDTVSMRRNISNFVNIANNLDEEDEANIYNFQRNGIYHDNPMKNRTRKGNGLH